MSTTQNILGRKVKCIMKQGTTETELELSKPACKDMKDEIHLDFTNASVSSDTIEQVGNDKVRRIEIVNVGNPDSKYTSGENSKYLSFIIQKYANRKLPSSNITISVDNQGQGDKTKKITLTFNVSCGSGSESADCTYANGVWKRQKTFTFTNDVKMTQEQFNNNCANQENDCNLQKDCDLGQLNTVSTCLTAANEKYESSITKQPNQSNQSSINCRDVFGNRFGQQIPNYNTSNITLEGNKVVYDRTCALQNTFEGKCSNDGDLKLVDKFKTCQPPNNAECKNKTCIELPSNYNNKTENFFRPNNAIPNTGKKEIILDITNGDATYVQTPEFRNFIKTKFGVDDTAQIELLNNNRLKITVDYGCGELEKTFENNGNCIYENNNWIKRYTQKFKNPVNIDQSSMNTFCTITNRTGTEDCKESIDCELREDTSVDKSCINNEQKIGFNIVKRNSSAGNSCRSLAEFNNPGFSFIEMNNKLIGKKSCSVAPVQNNVDCVVGNWGECSKPCDGGTQTRPIITNKQGTGRACPSTSQACNTQACPPPSGQNVDCVVGNWGECSKPCDGGTQSRPIITNKQGTGRECPALTQACNTEKCKKDEKTEDSKSNQMLFIIIGIMLLLIVFFGMFFMMRKN
jgi:hypothetical protein